MNVMPRVKKLISEHLGVDEARVVDTASIEKDLGADSLDAIELVMAFEEEFQIDISDDEADKLQTVDDIVNMIDAKVTVAL